MGIISDTGWVTASTGRCYYSMTRVVKFDPSTPREEIEALVNEHNAKPKRGQSDSMWVKRDDPFTVAGFMECDSGD